MCWSCTVVTCMEKIPLLSPTAVPHCVWSGVPVRETSSSFCMLSGSLTGMVSGPSFSKRLVSADAAYGLWRLSVLGAGIAQGQLGSAAKLGISQAVSNTFLL